MGLAVDAIVMCHECWGIRQDKFGTKISANYDKWNKDVISNSAAIRKAMDTLQYYDFEDMETIKKIKSLVKNLKGAALDGQ